MGTALLEPAYLALLRSGELAVRAAKASERLSDCDLCARLCHVNRYEGIAGAVCRTGEKARVHGFGPHFGEEDPLRGTRGSGTIFFSMCNLRCDFCQNWTLSQRGDGVEVSPEELAAQMLELQHAGCHNINLVSPSHVVAQVLAALEIAAGRGLALPIVFNTGGYDSLEALRLLDGVVDIYMPDFKYWTAESAARYLTADDYPERARQAIAEMHRQVGDLRLDHDDVAFRGLLVRHLVMPGGYEESAAIFDWLAALSPSTFVNVMAQYRPAGLSRSRPADFPAISRPLFRDEFTSALARAETAGLLRASSW